MDTDLKGLLEQIQREGVEKARVEADKILSEARKLSDTLIHDGEQKIARSRSLAETEIQRQEESSKAALVQAGRDLLLMTQRKLTEIFHSLLQDSVAETMKGEFLERLMMKAVENWKEDSVRLEISTSESDELVKNLKNKLAQKFSKGFDVLLSDHFTKGFKIGTKDGAIFYDFSPATLSEVFSELINPLLIPTIQKAAE